jgi:hypothetical protein
LPPAVCPILGVAAYVADDSSIAANSETKDPIENLRMLFSIFFIIYFIG